MELESLRKLWETEKEKPQKIDPIQFEQHCPTLLVSFKGYKPPVGKLPSECNNSDKIRATNRVIRSIPSKKVIPIGLLLLLGDTSKNLVDQALAYPQNLEFLYKKASEIKEEVSFGNLKTTEGKILQEIFLFLKANPKSYRYFDLVKDLVILEATFYIPPSLGGTLG